jgi:hypothetical protein
LVETKQKSGIQRVLELEAQVSEAHTEAGRKQKQVEALEQKLKEFGKKELRYIDESEAIAFFSGLIKDKDAQIRALTAQGQKLTVLEQERAQERD